MAELGYLISDSPDDSRPRGLDRIRASHEYVGPVGPTRGTLPYLGLEPLRGYPSSIQFDTCALEGARNVGRAEGACLRAKESPSWKFPQE
jgi:hypothetical protein